MAVAPKSILLQYVMVYGTRDFSFTKDIAVRNVFFMRQTKLFIVGIHTKGPGLETEFEEECRE